MSGLDGSGVCQSGGRVVDNAAGASSVQHANCILIQWYLSLGLQLSSPGRSSCFIPTMVHDDLEFGWGVVMSRRWRFDPEKSQTLLTHLVITWISEIDVVACPSLVSATTPCSVTLLLQIPRLSNIEHEQYHYQL